MKWPRCEASITTAVGEPEFVVCPSCGIRLSRVEEKAEQAAPEALGPGSDIALGRDLEPVLGELRSVRQAQEDTLAILRSRASPDLKGEMTSSRPLSASSGRRQP